MKTTEISYYTTNNDYSGLYELEFGVIDDNYGLGDDGPEEITILITLEMFAFNHPPYFVSETEDLTLDNGSFETYQISFADPDSLDTITASVVISPPAPFIFHTSSSNGVTIVIAMDMFNTD